MSECLETLEVVLGTGTLQRVATYETNRSRNFCNTLRSTVARQLSISCASCRDSEGEIFFRAGAGTTSVRENILFVLRIRNRTDVPGIFLAIVPSKHWGREIPSWKIAPHDGIIAEFFVGFFQRQ